MENDIKSQAQRDIEILAEAQRIRDDGDRSDAVRLLSKDKKKGRAADIFAREGSLAAKLKARRDAIESGDIEGAQAAFENN